MVFDESGRVETLLALEHGRKEASLFFVGVTQQVLREFLADRGDFNEPWLLVAVARRNLLGDLFDPWQLASQVDVMSGDDVLDKLRVGQPVDTFLTLPPRAADCRRSSSLCYVALTLLEINVHTS